MAYAIPDLSTFTFTDPSVESFARAMISMIEANQAIIDEFAKSLIENPVRALERSLSVKLAAVRQNAAKEALEQTLDTLLHGTDKTWAVIKLELQQALLHHVVYHASRSSRSTNAEANDMERFDLQAKAELLDRVMKGRF
ncbi:hypothetical protein D869_gp163 [Caulobacter phage CcrRogue]|uniref:Uncharacterized protein n=1 Tax=Caulobacter phage CcrRogue TaxID=2927986 RepID=K4JP18_9CAUD|nr:hypothetical protein D869_gp163 [Caulobacter phage CcrRogue]AFU86751.1 hypothetical protein CcrRogue_gp269 [Caulobacter phage CcrRogue]